MSIGVDAAAGIAGLISLSVTLFHGCVKSIAIIAAARQADHSIERLSLMLELEQVRLLEWGERAGLCDDARGNSKLNWDVVHRILEQMSSDITDIEHLRQRYNLNVSDAATPQADSASAIPNREVADPQQSGLRNRLWQRVGSKIRKMRAEIMQQNMGRLNRLRWVQVDREKAQLLVSHISYFNNALQEMLHDSHQQSIKNDMDSLLRDLISHSNRISDLEIIQAFIQPKAVAHPNAIRSASHLKQTRMYLGIDREANEIVDITFPRPKLATIKYENLSHLETIGGGKIQVAEYKASSKRAVHAHVLLESRIVDKNVVKQVRRRMMGLTLLLATAHHSLHALKCLGFLEHAMSDTSTMCAYVFETRDIRAMGDEARQQVIPKPLSLRTALGNSRRPGLSERLDIMLAMAENVLQLHTAGWLHKGISSDNVLFLETSEDTWHHGQASGPYIAGYEFTRHSIEETENMPFDKRQLLYKHHDLLNDNMSNTTKSRFRKQYDLHSLGCVLLELALWRSLEEILSTDMLQISSKPITSNAALHGISKDSSRCQYEERSALLKAKSALSSPDAADNILHEVAFAGGKSLRKVVELCFFPSLRLNSQLEDYHSVDGTRDDDSDSSGDIDVAELNVEVQLHVVSILRSLCVHV